MEGKTFEDAIAVLARLISTECQRLPFLLESTKINRFDKEYLEQLIKKELDIVDMKFAPAQLMRILHTHYGKQVILLIDEYDVPLDKANSSGFYNEMVDFLRGFFGCAFKTNPDLYFAVVTGCPAHMT